MYVPCAVKMFHLLPAACQYVSYFVRWTNDWLCLVLLLALSCVAYIFLEHAYMRMRSLKYQLLYFTDVPCAVKMFHLLAITFVHRYI